MVKYAKLGISEDFRDKDWDSLFNLQAIDSQENEAYSAVFSAAKKWCKYVIQGKTDLSLFMYGMNGSGKSTLGCIVLKSLYKNGIPVLRVTAVRLQQDFFAGWIIPEYALMRGVLLIDEVGKEYSTKQGHSETVLEYILKYRTERKLKTILVANADIEDLNKRYGATVNSILRGKFLPLAFPLVDLRQRCALCEVEKFMEE